MARLAVTALSLVVAAGATAQHQLPAAGVLFDDFVYQNAAPPLGGIGDRPLGEEALFGVNPWCLDVACVRTAAARAWYWYHPFETYFQRVDSLSALHARADGTGALEFVLEAGRHRLDGRFPRQVASGFAGRTGVWAAQADFSALPNGLPPEVRPAGAPAGRAPMMQSFWLYSPHQTVRTPDPAVPTPDQRKGATELDFEFNNWFYDAARPRYMATGFHENGEDLDGYGSSFHSMPLQAPARPGGGLVEPYSCLVERWSAAGAPLPASYGPPAVCEAALAGADPEAGPDVPTLMLVRVEPARVRFELRATWTTPAGRGALSMETPWFDGAGGPSQLTAFMLSFYLVAPDGAGVVTVPARQRLHVDWVYHSPDASRSIRAVAADVALVQARRTADGRPALPRLYTIPDADPARSLARPYRMRTDADREPAYEPIVALDPVRVSLDGPATAPLDGPAEYVARLDRRAGDYLFEWRSAPVARDGSSGPPTPYESTPGFRWRPALAFGRAPCARVEVRVTRMEFHNGADGVWWTPILSTGRDRAEASVVTCAPGAQRPRTTP